MEPADAGKGPGTGSLSQPPEETNAAHTLFSDSRPPELRESISAYGHLFAVPCYSDPHSEGFQTES